MKQLASLILLATLSSLAAPTTVAGSPVTPTAPGDSYDRALAVCRFMHGGRPNLRGHVASNNSYVQPCLRRRGWHADGTPLVVLGPP